MNLKKQYTQAIKALKDMELDITGVPTLEQIKAVMPEPEEDVQLVIYPKLHQAFDLPDLIAAFDKKQKQATWVWKDLWNQYDFKEEPGWKASLVFMEQGDVKAFYTNKTLAKQRELVSKSPLFSTH